MKLKSGAAECRMMELWHGTGEGGVEGIPRTGFRLPDWSEENMFGQGAYFATDSSKSAQEIYTKGTHCLILCDVLLGKACEVPGLSSKHELKKHVKRSKKRRLYLDVDLKKVRGAGFDSVFAPRNTRDKAGVQFDEMIVYDPAQALPRYVVHFTQDSFTVSTTGITASKGIVRHTLKPKREFDPTDELDMHFRVAESIFMRLGSGRKLDSVTYVINPKLLLEFEKKQKQLAAAKKPAEIVLAFHGTRKEETIENIVTDNFNVAFIGSQTDSGWWGRGFYFSENVGLSLAYGTNLLLCRLLPGKVFDVHERMDGQPITPGYDSHRLSKDEHGYGQELVIPEPAQVLPCYILHIK